MNRVIRVAAATGLMVLFPILTACASAGSASHGTPAATSTGPVTANSGGRQAGICVPGAPDESLVSIGIYSSGLKMIDASNGWALGQCGPPLPSFPQGSTLQCYWPQSQFSGILRTSDGGKTWTDVSPPSVPNRSFEHAEFFLDTKHAWVGEVSRTADACVSAVTTFITTDGGLTWNQGGTIAVRSEAPTSGLFDIPGPTHAMDFIDPQHGWILVDATTAYPQPTGMLDRAYLYATADSGVHWKLVATNPGQSQLGGGSGCSPAYYQPGSDPMFVSQTVGWFSIECVPTGLGLLRTDDGGATWKMKTLPCACQVWLPEVFDATHLVVTGTQGSPVMLTTSDGGGTWTQRAVPAAVSTYFSFIGQERGWMVGTVQLPKGYQTVVYRTTDGGASWSPLGRPTFTTSSSDPSAFYPIEDVQFVSSTSGFVTLGAEARGQGAPVTDPSAPEFQIMSTADGGQTWSTVLRQLPAAPCHNQYTSIGPGDGALLPAKMATVTVGWAKGGLRTEDGGAHWRDMSPSALRGGATTPLYPPSYTDFFLDGDHAWQTAVYASRTSCSDHVSTFGTTDGGKTWRQSAPIALNLRSGDGVASLGMGFTSPQDGRLWIEVGSHGQDPMFFQASEADIYATSDGGMTWSHVSSVGATQLQALPVPSSGGNCKPSPGQIGFSAASVGWMQVNCSDVSMLVTRDGGISWKRADFQVPSSVGCPCYLQLPLFVDADHGFVIGSNQSGAGDPVLLITADGGLSWHVASRPGTGYLLMLGPVDAKDAFALTTPPGWSKGSSAPFEVYRSSDAGQTWSLVSSTVPATWPPGFFQFVDLNHGFEANVNGATTLLSTSDGGKTWKSITPAIVT